MPAPTSRLAAALAASALLALPAAGRAGGMDMSDPHAHHHADGMRRAERSTADVTLPAVDLVRDDGAAVPLIDAVGGEDGRPVAVEFIFTTCTTICPVMSRVFSEVQEKLGADRDRVHLVSISIDPEQDTPGRLVEYGRRYHAGPGWRFFTGTVAASVAAQRAFGVYRGDKMDHLPTTFLRVGRGSRWLRIDGFASADELARELHELVAAR